MRSHLLHPHPSFSSIPALSAVMVVTLWWWMLGSVPIALGSDPPERIAAVADSLIAAGEDSLAVGPLRLAGEGFRAAGRPEAAHEAWVRALELAETTGSARETRTLLSLLHESRLEAGMLTEALDLGDRLIELSPAERPLAALLLRQGTTRLELGLAGDALEDLNRADTLLTGNGEGGLRAGIAFARAEALLRTGSPRESVEAVRRALTLADQLDPDRRLAARELEMAALLEAGELAAADSVYEAQTGGTPTRRGLETAARLRLATRDTTEAWILAERAAAIPPPNGSEGSPAEPGLAPAPPWPDAAGLLELSRRLGEIRGAILQFTSGTGGAPIAFAIHGRGVSAHVLSGFAQTETLAAEEFARLASGATLESRLGTLRRISAALVAPLLAGLPGDVERIFVVPPASLIGFPFEILPVPAAGETETLLGAAWGVSVLPSAGALPVLDTRPAAEVGMLILADPRIAVPPQGSDNTPESARSPLPEATAAEVAAVRIPGALVLSGPEASRSRLFTPTARLQSVIHISAPIEIRARRPRTSTLTLAGEPGTLDIPTLESLALSADLVTLTGIHGASSPGEGAAVFPRAFLVAGARAVVINRWESEARGRERLLERFHGHLGKGRARDESLRRARKSMMAEGFLPREYLGLALHGAGHLPVAAIASYPTPLPVLWGLLVVVLVTGALVALVRRGRRRRPQPRPPRVMPPPVEPDWEPEP